jgi:hypothetical protein
MPWDNIAPLCVIAHKMTRDISGEIAVMHKMPLNL